MAHFFPRHGSVANENIFEGSFLVVLNVSNFRNCVVVKFIFMCIACYGCWIADIPVKMLFLGPVLYDAH